MELSEAGKWLERALVELGSDLSSGIQLDSDVVYTLVSYCEMAKPPDASEYLQNIVGDDRCKDIVAEYMLRRGGATAEIPEKSMQAYQKPREEESLYLGTRKPHKEKDFSSQRDLDQKYPSSGNGAISSQNGVGQKGKRGKRGGKGVSLAEASKGLVVFQRSGPCSCQCTRHKLVNNCLSCGRIVCEQEGEGPCTFCGALVLREGSDYAGLEGGGVPPATDAEAAAEEFKNRLVEYDRTAAARTTVIDDQSDYFQIDGNTWLTDQEKKLLKTRQEEEERLAEERRKRVVVTVDLLGRKVVMADQHNEKEEGDNSSILASDMFLGSNLEGVSRIKANPYLEESPIFIDPRESASSGKLGHMEKSSAAMHRNNWKKSARIQHDDPLVEALIGQNLDNLREVGITADELNGWQAPKARVCTQTEDDGSSVECQREPAGISRVPDPVARNSVSGKGRTPVASKVDGPVFDICLPRKTGKQSHVVLSPSLIVQKQKQRKDALNEANAKTSNIVLLPGMILLKHWLTLDQQVDIVKQCQLLGVGPGGFYQPQYGEHTKMHLKMMCLGMQWEPVARAYGPRRIHYDNAMPPSIPDSFLRVVDKALSVAQVVTSQELGAKSKRVVIDKDSTVPHIVPNVCIVNFYEHSGNLGMHQDKDESPESLHRGLPVVSFSVGDSAEFVYGIDAVVEKAQRLILESGDVLIFGGPSRMIFHGITHVNRGTAPQDLLEKTNLRPGRLNLTFRQY